MKKFMLKLTKKCEQKKIVSKTAKNVFSKFYEFQNERKVPVQSWS
jgi:hypothetical protein